MRRNWKRRFIYSLLLLLVAIAISGVFVFSRLHFSHQDFPFLAYLQSSPANSSARIRPQIIGHRGSALPSTDPNAKRENKQIGNTARAIQAAIDAKVDWIEIDVRKTKDGLLIAFHDADVTAKTTGSKSGNVSHLTLDELKTLDLLVHPKEKIPTLDEVYEEFHAKDRKWILDIKETGLEKEMAEWLDINRLKKEQIILFGSDKVLESYRDCGYALGYVASWKENRWVGLFAPSEIIKRCERLDCDYLVLPMILA